MKLSGHFCLHLVIFAFCVSKCFTVYLNLILNNISTSLLYKYAIFLCFLESGILKNMNDLKSILLWEFALKNISFSCFPWFFLKISSKYRALVNFFSQGVKIVREESIRKEVRSSMYRICISNLYYRAVISDREL